MKWVTLTVLCLCCGIIGGLGGWMLAPYSVVKLPGAAPPNTLQLTYNDFVTVLFTVATFMLGAVAVGVGVVAAYTIGSLREESKVAAEKAAEKYAQVAVAAATKDLDKKVAAIAFGAGQQLSWSDDSEGYEDEER